MEKNSLCQRIFRKIIEINICTSTLITLHMKPFFLLSGRDISVINTFGLPLLPKQSFMLITNRNIDHVVNI